MSIDLTTQYGTLVLDTPVVIGSCPMTAHEVTRIGLITSGAGAIVLPSLFETQVREWNTRQGYSHQTVAQPQPQKPVCKDAESYLEIVRRAKSQMSIPLIASLNGASQAPWLNFAMELQEAGADGIELHVSNRQSNEQTDPRQIEDSIIDTAMALDEALTIPFFLKLGRNFTSISHLASRLHAGMQGLVLFGRSPETDIELDSLQLSNRWGLTEAGSFTQSLLPIMQVRARCPELSIAASGGISSAGDVAKALLAGANVAMVTSAVYRDGPDMIGLMINGLVNFMEQRGIESVEQLKSHSSALRDANVSVPNDHYAMAPTLADSSSTAVQRAIQCDRWGHPNTPR